MPFDYDSLLGPTDYQEDSEAVRNYKAGTGAFRYALEHAGWSEEQIANALRTHFGNIVEVLSEHVQGLFVPGSSDDARLARHVARVAVAEMHLQPGPCSHKGCHTNHGKELAK